MYAEEREEREGEEMRREERRGVVRKRSINSIPRLEQRREKEILF